jgi:hypothetical protein
VLLPNANECDIIFEALDEDASGGISLDEWNLWILDGLSSSGLERQKMGLTDMGKKMDLMLVCLEQLANEAGKLLGQRERGQNICWIVGVRANRRRFQDDVFLGPKTKMVTPN